MGLYNMLFGQNPEADFLLGLVDLTRDEVGRFRDCFVNEDGTEIAVYTRNGGGNREDYMPDFSGHPLYLRDEDDDFDCTYATIYFTVPEQAKALVKDLAEKRDPNKLWLETLEALKAGKRPDIVEKMRPTVEALVAAIDSRG